uniref:Uncharacterized protein n=1 Tax=Heterorhabditis bacteriophora TaxID=37862 RepID=A0A1I7XR43_HETBA
MSTANRDTRQRRHLLSSSDVEQSVTPGNRMPFHFLPTEAVSHGLSCADYFILGAIRDTCRSTFSAVK